MHSSWHASGPFLICTQTGEVSADRSHPTSSSPRIDRLFTHTLALLFLVSEMLGRARQCRKTAQCRPHRRMQGARQVLRRNVLRKLIRAQEAQDRSLPELLLALDSASAAHSWKPHAWLPWRRCLWRPRRSPCACMRACMPSLPDYGSCVLQYSVTVSPSDDCCTRMKHLLPALDVARI